MDKDLAALLKISRKLPKIGALRRVGRQLRKRYLREHENIEPVVTDVLGFQMRLDPKEYVDGALLFYPQLYDIGPIAFVQNTLKSGDTFLDLGANIGYYALVASQAVGPSGTVVAVEADPGNFEKMRFNFELNELSNVRPLNLGVSDKSETLRLGINTDGNRGANTFHHSENFEEGVDVQCAALSEILQTQRIEKVAGAKLDLEGFEFRVLKQFFEDVDESLYPGFLIVELNLKPFGDYRDQAKQALELLQSRGYRVAQQASRENYVLVRS